MKSKKKKKLKENTRDNIILFVTYNQSQFCFTSDKNQFNHIPILGSTSRFARYCLNRSSLPLTDIIMFVYNYSTFEIIVHMQEMLCVLRL